MKLLLRRQRRMLPAALARRRRARRRCSLAAPACVHALRPAAASSRERLRQRRPRASACACSDIVIEGRANTPEPLLRAALGVIARRSDPGFSVAGARDRIETLTGCRHAAVERRLPGTIVVQLTERRPFADLAERGQVRADRPRRPDRDRSATSPPSPPLPLVVGAGAPGRGGGAARCAGGACPICRRRVAAAVRVGERRWNLQLNNGTDVLLPEGARSAGAGDGCRAADAARAARPAAAGDRPAPARPAGRARAVADAATMRRSAAAEQSEQEGDMNDMPRRAASLPPADAGRSAAARAQPRAGPFGVLDIGTTKIACLIGRTESDGTLRVLGFGWQRGRGVRGGGITDLEEAERAIRAAVGQAEDMADHRLRSRHRQSLLRPAGKPAVQRAMAGRRPRGHRAGRAPRAVAKAARARSPKAARSIHALPLAFSVDETAGRGRSARPALRDAGRAAARGRRRSPPRCAPRRLPWAAAISISPNSSPRRWPPAWPRLVEDERELGATVSTWAAAPPAWRCSPKASLLHTAQLPVGGVHVTNDIAARALHAGRACRAAEDAVRQRACQPRRRARDAAGAAGRRGGASDRQGAAQHGGQHHPPAARGNLRDGAGPARGAGPRPRRRHARRADRRRQPACRRARDGAAASSAARCALGRPAALRGLPDSASGPAFATAAGLLAWAAGEGRTLHDIDSRRRTAARPARAASSNFSANASDARSRIGHARYNPVPGEDSRHDPEPDHPASDAHRLHAAHHRHRRRRRRHQRRRQHDRAQSAGRGFRRRQHRRAAADAQPRRPAHPARPAPHAGPGRRRQAGDRPRRGRGSRRRTVCAISTARTWCSSPPAWAAAPAPAPRRSSRAWPASATS